MNSIFKSLLTLGAGAAIEYLRAEKPLRTWIRKRRAAKGKDPLVDQARIDELADEGLEKARKEVDKVIKK
jgi:hypothetical protein